jgi:very-short-patch-repair endonuclease
VTSRRDFARNLRNNPTQAEYVLWQALSYMRPRVTRQLRVDPFVGDFACRRARLVVEADGSQHAESLSDRYRTRDFERDGWRVIRFWNNDILGNVEGVLTVIAEAVNARLPDGEQVYFSDSRAGRSRNPRSRGKEEDKKRHP